jgi:hypothetical protein
MRVLLHKDLNLRRVKATFVCLFLQVLNFIH